MFCSEAPTPRSAAHGNCCHASGQRLPRCSRVASAWPADWLGRHTILGMHVHLWLVRRRRRAQAIFFGVSDRWMMGRLAPRAAMLLEKACRALMVVAVRLSCANSSCWARRWPSLHAQRSSCKRCSFHGRCAARVAALSRDSSQNGQIRAQARSRACCGHGPRLFRPRLAGAYH